MYSIWFQELNLLTNIVILKLFACSFSFVLCIGCKNRGEHYQILSNVGLSLRSETCTPWQWFKQVDILFLKSVPPKYISDVDTHVFFMCYSLLVRWWHVCKCITMCQKGMYFSTLFGIKVTKYTLLLTVYDSLKVRYPFHLCRSATDILK